MNVLILQVSPRAKGNTAWMADEYKNAAEAAGHNVTLVNVAHKHIAGCLACEYCHGKGNGQAPIQRMYCVNAPAKVKKMALLCSSYSPGVYDGATAEFRDICNYWHAENMGVVTAKIDEQKTDATKQKIVDLVAKL